MDFLQKICTYLTEKDESVSSIERLAELYHEQRPGDCQEPSWEGMLEFLSSQNAQIEGTRSWIWQTCTEFGFYQTCEVGSNCPFGKGFHVLDQDLEICEQAFGIDKDKVKFNVQDSLDYYGGWDIKGSRIMFTNGDVDPWSELAVTGKLGSKAQPTLMIK